LPVAFQSLRDLLLAGLYSAIRVRALILIQDNPATIFTIANTGAMLRVGQKRFKDIAP